MSKTKCKRSAVKGNFESLGHSSDAAEERRKALAECMRIRSMSPSDRLAEAARRDRSYADSKMRVTFPSLRDIRHVKGVIMLVADNAASMREALKSAEDTLGPGVSHEAIMKYAEQHRVKTTLMSVATFKRNLMTVLRMVNGHAEMFGAGSGGGVLKDIYQAGVSAIAEAEKFWAGNNKILTQGIKDLMTMGSSTDEAMFSAVLGKEWKRDNTLDPETKKLLGL